MRHNREAGFTQQYAIMSCFKKLFWINLTSTFSPYQVTSGTRRNWAMIASSSTRSRWQPGTAARREPCTAFLSALTSSRSANLAGKVGPYYICLSVFVCKDFRQVWLCGVYTPRNTDAVVCVWLLGFVQSVCGFILLMFTDVLICKWLLIVCVPTYL